MPHTWEWAVRLHRFEDGTGTTKAHLVLATGTRELTGHGTAHCHPEDPDVPETGAELAAGRAMNDLARQLLKIAERDIGSAGAPQPHGRRAVRWPM